MSGDRREMRFGGLVDLGAGTPGELAAMLHRELTAILAEPATQEQVRKFGFVPVANRSIADLQAFVKSETVRWGQVVRDAGIAGSQ